MKCYKVKDALDHNRIIKRYLTKRSALKKMAESIYYWIDEDIVYFTIMLES